MHRSKRLLSVLLTLAMVLGMLPGQAFAAVTDSSGETIPKGVNGYQATAWADADTSDGYTAAFDSRLGQGTEGITVFQDGNAYRSSALNGKIWADKSITAEDTKNDGIDRFNVTISALGQTYMTKGVAETAAGLDVVFVLDFSGSMTTDRVTGMTTAANNALKTLMANANNRAAIVTFNTKKEGIWEVYTQNINTPMGMDHYSAGNDENFLQCQGKTVSIVDGVKNSNGNTVNFNQT